MTLVRLALLSLALLGCGPSTSGSQDAAPGSHDGPIVVVDAAPVIDASSTLGSAFRFAIIGDTRPPNEDDTAHYPKTIIN